jgi:hypothetical protein
VSISILNIQQNSFNTTFDNLEILTVQHLRKAEFCSLSLKMFHQWNAKISWAWMKMPPIKHYLYLLYAAVFLEKLTGLQLVKKFPTFYGNQRFITAFTSARHLSLSWASSILSIHPHSTSWKSILTHCGPVTQICVFCVTTVKDGWHKIAFEHALGIYALNYPIHGAFFNLVLWARFLKTVILLWINDLW